MGKQVDQTVIRNSTDQFRETMSSTRRPIYDPRGTHDDLCWIKFGLFTKAILSKKLKLNYFLFRISLEVFSFFLHQSKVLKSFINLLLEKSNHLITTVKKSDFTSFVYCFMNFDFTLHIKSPQFCSSSPYSSILTSRKCPELSQSENKYLEITDSFGAHDAHDVVPTKTTTVTVKTVSQVITSCYLVVIQFTNEFGRRAVVLKKKTVW